jgi:hypothetical protein
MTTKEAVVRLAKELFEFLEPEIVNDCCGKYERWSLKDAAPVWCQDLLNEINLEKGMGEDDFVTDFVARTVSELIQTENPDTVYPRADKDIMALTRWLISHSSRYDRLYNAVYVGAETMYDALRSAEEEEILEVRDKVLEALFDAAERLCAIYDSNGAAADEEN